MIPAGMGLSDVVRRSGVPASTIHLYRRLGLLPPLVHREANRFTYSERHVEALRLIRLLRDRRGLPLSRIADVLPGLLAGEDAPGDLELGEDVAALGVDSRRRLVEVAIELFSVHSYAEVTMSDIASAAGVAKGSVYRHFPSKEALFDAVVEELMEDTAARFAAAVRELGGAEGLAGNPVKAATVFASLVARAMPILLELGVRAIKGHEPSQERARRVLRTLAEAAGRPLSADPIPAGLAVINNAFATVLDWAVEPDWPEGAEFGA
ncbi:MAG TPA: TetR family transcriptional regulator, partial [Acidimicrobiales bacterium]|nr:TetR family transcriptional regulator [Acidimicrobiales bacterium]